MSGAEESEEEDEDVAGGWRQARGAEVHIASASASKGNTVLHSGYLWKKGSGRRKVACHSFLLLRLAKFIYRLGRSDGLFFVPPISPVIRPPPNTNYFGCWRSPIYMPPLPSNSNAIPIPVEL
jgi:hypothetical protein